MPNFTPEELQRYRSERPWNNDLPDEALVTLFDFQGAVLGYRVSALGREILAALPSWLQRWLGA